MQTLGSKKVLHEKAGSNSVFSAITQVQLQSHIAVPACTDSVFAECMAEQKPNRPSGRQDLGKLEP